MNEELKKLNIQVRYLWLAFFTFSVSIGPLLGWLVGRNSANFELADTILFKFYYAFFSVFYLLAYLGVFSYFVYLYCKKCNKVVRILGVTRRQFYLLNFKGQFGFAKIKTK